MPDRPHVAQCRCSAGVALGSVVVILGLATAAAGAHGIRAYHAVAGHGQYLNISISGDGAGISAARMRERCRPGGRHQLVGPNFLVPGPIPVGTGGRFSKLIQRGGARTRYRGYVNGGSVVLKVVDSADSKCDGAAQRFVARLIK